MALADVAEDAAAPRGGRIAALDVVRGIALAAMILYHFSFDLRMFGLTDADVVNGLGWKLFARATAGTFLALVGVNLVLATRHGLKRQPYLRRLAMIAGAAALVSLGTWWFDSSTFVYFGILHEIALASVLALPFLRLQPWITALVAAAIIALPVFVALPFMDHPALAWIGLAAHPRQSIDYVPVFPWFGVVLAGVVAGRLFLQYVADSPLARWDPGDTWPRSLMVVGRWSLVIYLIHQPILVGILYLTAPLTMPRVEARRAFMGDCVAACTAEGRGGDTCAAYCSCMFPGLYGSDLYNIASRDAMTEEQRQRVDALSRICAANAPAAQ